MSTPLMGLTLPTDHGSIDTWDVILGVVFNLIDGHDHTTGKGAQVPSAALKINADVSWASAGVSRAITDLKAIDFTPTASTGVASLAAALFVSDGTGGLSANELYWRTTTGSNVKLTSGAALNVVAFAGGIGGDYSAVGALVDFDDATDSYRFRQQVGAGVRQFARMQSADVDLFEYKASPAAGVPTNRVRLASPAALAASYTLTMPAGLPAKKVPLMVSASGAVTADVNALMYPAALAQPTVSGHTFRLEGSWEFAAITAIFICPVQQPIGTTISSFTVFMNKTTAATSSLEATLVESGAGGGGELLSATQINSAANPGQIQLTGPASFTVQAGKQYFIRVIRNGVVAAGDFLQCWSVTP